MKLTLKSSIIIILLLSDNLRGQNAQLSSIQETYVDKSIPGVSLLVARGNTILHFESKGWANLEDSIPLNTDHFFPLASIGKMYCGIMIQQMIQADLLRLDAPLINYLDEAIIKQIPNGEKLSIAHLLSHTSGIPDFADDPSIFEEFQSDPEMSFARDRILTKYVFGKNPLFSAGEQFSYSNSNYEILTLIADQVLPAGHATWYSDSIFRAIGLKESFYKKETNYQPPFRFSLAQGYFDPFQQKELISATEPSLRIAKGMTGSDGIISSLSDLHLFMQGIFNTKLVDAKTLERMQNYPQKELKMSYRSYGLGLLSKEVDGLVAWGHSGALPGYTLEAYYFPSKDLYLIYALNVGIMLDIFLEEDVDTFKREIYSEVLQQY